MVWTMLLRTSSDAGETCVAEEPRDAHYFGAKKLGHGKGYVYPPNDPAGYQVDYLPHEPKGKTYYEPSGNGEERDPSGR